MYSKAPFALAGTHKILMQPNEVSPSYQKANIRLFFQLPIFFCVHFKWWKWSSCWIAILTDHVYRNLQACSVSIDHDFFSGKFNSVIDGTPKILEKVTISQFYKGWSKSLRKIGHANLEIFLSPRKCYTIWSRHYFPQKTTQKFS